MTWIKGIGKRQIAFEALDAEGDGKINITGQEEAKLVAAHLRLLSELGFLDRDRPILPGNCSQRDWIGVALAL